MKAQNIKIYNKDNQEVQDSALVTTGTKIVLDGEFEYTFVVTGDIDGSGKIEIRDLLAINKHRLGKNKLSGIYFEAGDINQDGKIDIIDLLQENKARLGKINL